MKHGGGHRAALHQSHATVRYTTVEVNKTDIRKHLKKWKELR